MVFFSASASGMIEKDIMQSPIPLQCNIYENNLKAIPRISKQPQYTTCCGRYGI